MGITIISNFVTGLVFKSYNHACKCNTCFSLNLKISRKLEFYQYNSSTICKVHGLWWTHHLSWPFVPLPLVIEFWRFPTKKNSKFGSDHDRWFQKYCQGANLWGEVFFVVGRLLFRTANGWVFWRVNDVSLVFRTIWIRVEFLTTRIWTFLGVWTQIIAWSRCFGGGRNMRLFGWDVFFLPRIAVIHLTHMNPKNQPITFPDERLLRNSLGL